MVAPIVPVEGLVVTASNGIRSHDSVINLDHGDPMIYEKFWKETGDVSSFKIQGWENMSYFSDRSNLCWFLHHEFASQIRRIHRLVGNAFADENCHIVVGNGSTQLFQAALYALSTHPSLAETCRPIPVVSVVPHYSGYPAATDVLQSALYKWAGDANSFDPHATDPFIEVICSPNNPDGLLNNSVFKQITNNIHDLAYYWPQYTPITNAADYNIMLFTVSKCTGHAGSRLGWALVKDKDVASRMVQFVELGTIGVSKDSQLRAATILRAVADGYEEGGGYKLFHFGRKVMTERWDRLRQVLMANGAFSLLEYPPPAYCGFMREKTSHLPAFAWLKYEGNLDIEDTANFLRTKHNMLTRSGKHFGTDSKYVRISLLEREETFNIFIDRMSSIF
ncbi:hypothetical protein IEQ34_004566 [Dendrobium chrysotoxum]|uniref:Alliinase C-terminal domain-containing protein n=1 Tax=Dendrobium chrysotoxum TaxID=161865 RepID=A0AAV7HIQ8_DENCH|nr:hypothetical protein IEQ34_004566 [Dendrobium chrysotoxum]